MTTEIKISGTKATVKVTPKNTWDTVRKLDYSHGEKGTENKPHSHVKLPKSFISKLFGK